MSESLITKKAIADGFRSLTEKKAFDKITVSDITSACGLNRQTFHYHFRDKYELINWIFYNEIISPITENYNIDEWSDGILQTLKTLKAHSKFYINALNTPYSDEFRKYFCSVTAQLFSRVLDRVVQGYSRSAEVIDIKFVSEFLSYGVSGSIINWILTGMKESPESVALKIKNIITDSKSVVSAHYMNSGKSNCCL